MDLSDEGSSSATPTETAIDLLVVAGRVVTMNPDRAVIVDGAVAVSNGAILAVGPQADLRRRFRARTTIDEPDGIVTPGYIDAHQHLTGDRLLRSTIPDTISSGEAIFGWAVPLHRAQDGDDDLLAATLACAEALRNGVTTIVDAGTVAYPDAVAEAAEHIGIRASIGRWGWDIGDGPDAAPASVVLDRLEMLLARYPPEPTLRIRGAVTLVGHDLMTDELLLGASELARSAGAMLTFHISPSRADAPAYLERTGRRPIQHFADLGVLDRNVLLAHAVHLDDSEVECVLESGAAIAYCPWAYLRLAQGVVRAGRHVEIVRRGGRIALGCDSENAGDQIDVLRAAALAAGLERDRAEDPRAFGAHQALELATVAGAEAVGLGSVVGSIEVGKRADLVVHRSSNLPSGGDVELELIWGTDGRSVVHVIVEGEVVVSDGIVVLVDLPALKERASQRSVELLRAVRH